MDPLNFPRPQLVRLDSPPYVMPVGYPLAPQPLYEPFPLNFLGRPLTRQTVQLDFRGRPIHHPPRIQRQGMQDMRDVLDRTHTDTHLSGLINKAKQNKKRRRSKKVFSGPYKHRTIAAYGGSRKR